MRNKSTPKHRGFRKLWLALALLVILPIQAEEANAPATPEKVKQWLSELNSDEYAKRETAQKNLRAACTQGEASKVNIELVNAALANTEDLEFKVRLKKILSGLEMESKVDTALNDLKSSDSTVLLAALDLLWDHSLENRVTVHLQELNEKANQPLKDIAASFLKHLMQNRSYQEELEKYRRKAGRNEEVMKVVSQQINTLAIKQKLEMQREVKEILDRAKPTK